MHVYWHEAKGRMHYLNEILMKELSLENSFYGALI